MASRSETSSPTTTARVANESSGTTSKFPLGDGGNCYFCLGAEFDIDRGSTLSHQYPAPIGHDDHILAELMLPDGIHARSEDWTAFFLPASLSITKSTSNSEYLMSAEDRDEGDAGLKGSKTSRGRTENLVYVLSFARTKHDTNVRRGASIKAVAIGVPHPFIHVFKPALLLALDDYFKSPSLDSLARLYDSLNALDLCNMPSFSWEEKIILRGNERRDLFEERFRDVAVLNATRPRTGSGSTTQSGDESRPGNVSDAMSVSQQGRSTPHLPHRPSIISLRQAATNSGGILRRRPSNAMQLDNASGSTPSQSLSRRPSGAAVSPMSMPTGKARDTHWWEASVSYGKVQDLPIRIPTDCFDEEVGEYSLIELITTFGSSTPTGPQHPHLHSNGHLTSPIILLFNAIITGKRVVFLGHNQPASKVASHVLAACALGTGCGAAWRGVAKRCFPYTNLVMMDELEKTPGYIAGVTNPRFEQLHAWDVLLNIESGKITIAKDIEPPPTIRANPRLPAMAESFSSGSISSLTGSAGVGHEAESRLNRAPSEADGSSVGHSVSGPSKLNRDKAGQIEGRTDSLDNAFMDEIQLSISARYGERHVRARFIDYALNFVKRVARHEEHFYGHCSFAPPSQPFLNGQLGSGNVYQDRETELRDIQANAMRIEGWRETEAYELFKADEALRSRSRAIQGFDVEHQVVRLRKAKNLAKGEEDLIFTTIAKSLRTDEQIIQLLSLLPPHEGGLSPISSGLLATSANIRLASLDILVLISTHYIGKKFVQNLNLFHRLAFARILQDVMEAQNPTHTPMTALPVPSAQATASPLDDGLPQSSTHTLPYSFGNKQSDVALAPSSKEQSSNLGLPHHLSPSRSHSPAASVGNV